MSARRKKPMRTATRITLAVLTLVPIVALGGALTVVDPLPDAVDQLGSFGAHAGAGRRANLARACGHVASHRNV